MEDWNEVIMWWFQVNWWDSTINCHVKGFYKKRRILGNLESMLTWRAEAGGIKLLRVATPCLIIDGN